MTYIYVPEDEFPIFGPTASELYAGRESIRVARDKTFIEAGRAVVGIPKASDRRLGVPHPTEFETYEKIYNKDGIVFRAVNTTADHVMQAGFRVIGESQENVDKIKEWMEYVGYHPFLHEVVRNLMIWGNAFTEIVSEKGTKRNPILGWGVMELKPLNPDTMYVYRYETGEVIGYIQRPKSRRWLWHKTRGKRSLPNRKRSVGKKHKTWKADVKSAYPDAVIFDPEDILHLKVNQLPSAEYGISPIESIKDTLITYLGVMGDISVIIKRYGSPKIIWRLGTEDRTPSRQMIDDFHSSMTSLNIGDDIVVPVIAQWQTLDAGLKVMDMAPYIQYLRDDLFAGFGVPELIMGGNVSGTQASAEIQLEAFTRRIIEVQRFLEIASRRQIFPRVLGLGSMPFSRDVWRTIPKLIFNPPDTIERIVLREITQHTAGIKSTEEIRDTLGYTPPLPEGETGIDLQVKVAQSRAAMPNVNLPGTRGPGQSTGGGKDDKTAAQKTKGLKAPEHK